MLRSTTGRALTALLLMAGLLLGCGKKTKDGSKNSPVDDDAATVEDGSDSASAEADSQLITSSLVATAPGTLTLESSGFGDDLQTNTFGDGAKAIYFPRGCLVVDQASAGNATYTFTKCIGPNGLRAVSGQVKATYTTVDGKLHLELTATDLAVNKATVDWSATADISQTADSTRTMSWKAQLSGTTARGRSFGRTNEYTITWKLGEACFSLNGTADGQVNGREIRTEIQDFQRCRRGCPEDGGKIVVTNVAKARTFEVDFDGTSQATLIDPKGRATTFPLVCEE